MMIVYILIGAVLLLVLLFINYYNRLVSLRHRRENAFADIDVQLKQRHDLIPQLVETVKGYTKHEEAVLTRITEARSKAMGAGSLDERVEAESEISAALQGLRIAVEAYPDLKASQNFLQLQEEMADIENKLAAARRFFNSATKEYNIATETFPSNMVAGMFGFTKKPMFDLGEEGRRAHETPPKVNF